MTQPQELQVPAPLSEFQEGQWWVNELDAMGRSGDPDQKRAVAVVHHLLLSIRSAESKCLAQQDKQ